MRALLAICISFVLSGVFSSISSSSCKLCPYTHPQDIFCHSEFVGVVRITKLDVVDEEARKAAGHKIAAQMTILKIYKGKYEDFEIGSSIYLYTPTEEDCQREYWQDDFMISGMPLMGGLASNKCNITETTSTFSDKQLRSMQSHIHNRAYEHGCHHCSIKKPYDYSAIKKDNCRHKYDEFPISTSACVPSGTSGRCKFVRVSKERYSIPRQAPPDAGAAPRDYIPAESAPPREGGCLYNRIIEESAASPKQGKEARETESSSGAFVFAESRPKTGVVRLKSTKPKTKVKKVTITANWGNTSPPKSFLTG